jgi:hypothetical protein
MSSCSPPFPETPDVLVHKASTLFLFCPLTDRAEAWIEEHIQLNGSALVWSRSTDSLSTSPKA